MPVSDAQARRDFPVLISLRSLWTRVDPSWKFALASFAALRVGLMLWSLVILSVFPLVLRNLDLYGQPVLATFDQISGERHTYSRLVDGRILTFKPGDARQVVDPSGSAWSLSDGRALSGPYEGRTLGRSDYTPEDIFPYRGVAPDSNPFLGIWQRFDANWYLAIAQWAYSFPGSTVYLPLYPALVRATSAFVADPLLAAILVSNACLLGALVLLYRLAARLTNAAAAKRTVAYFLLFPTAFFLLAPYGESLFLLLVLLSFLLAYRGSWWLAGAAGALAALTRLQGVLLLVPLGYMWFCQRSKPGPTERQVRLRQGIGLLLIPAATVAFLAVTNASLLTTYEGQLHARFVWPWDNFLAAVGLLMGGAGGWVDALNILAALLFAGMLIAVWKKLPREYSLYAALMLSAPLFRMTTEQPLVSMSRYVLVIFPVLVMWATWGTNAWVNRAVIYLSLALSLLLSAQYFMWGWVA